MFGRKIAVKRNKYWYVNFN